MIRFAVGLRADEIPVPDDRRQRRSGTGSAGSADADAPCAPGCPVIGTGAPPAIDAGFPRAFALAGTATAPATGPNPDPDPDPDPSLGCGAALLSAGTGAATEEIATGTRPLPGAAADGCPVFLAGVPIDEAGARWLSATAEAAQAGDADAALALWLALRPRFARWAAACLERTGAAAIRRDGKPWLLDDLLQEGYLVLLGVVADWPDRDRGEESGPAGAATDQPGSGADGRTNVPIAAYPSGDDPGTARAFLPWLLAVAPRRLFGALATLRERAGRPPGRGPESVPLSDADLLADGTTEAAEAAARLAALAATLDPLDGALLLAHVSNREPIVLAGRRLGLDRGAAYHRWHRVRARLRDELAR